MGNFSTKQSEDISKTAPVNETPKRPKVLPFDPRSPSDYISRTPITVTNVGDSLANGTPLNEKVKVLKYDPRSPSSEISRTPIEIDGKITKNRHQPLKPSKLASVSNDILSEVDDCDPRSPTEKVPRTPLEDSTFEHEKSPSTNECSDGSIIIKKEDNSKENSLENSIPKPQDALKNQVRVPLANIQNTSPREIGTKNNSNHSVVEEEYSKVQEKILTKLAPPQENTISTATQFIEDI